jgi:hypothetical protein
MKTTTETPKTKTERVRVIAKDSKFYNRTGDVVGRKVGILVRIDGTQSTMLFRRSEIEFV